MSRRALVLYATLLVILSAALAAGSVLAMLDGQRVSADTSRRRVAVRAGAWSAVQAVMAELASQRPALLEGEDPEITSEWALFDQEDDKLQDRLLLRVVQIGDQDLVSESAKLDANSADATMLATLPMLDDAGARAIVEGRAGGPFGSLDEVRSAGGVSESDRDAFGDLVTVFCVESRESSGVASNGTSIEIRPGDPRRSLTEAFDEPMREELDRELGAEAASCVEGMMSPEEGADSRGSMVRAMGARGLDPEVYGVLLDSYTPGAGAFAFGRVDINRAAPEVLECLPGIDSEAAAQIVFSRDNLDASTLASVAWPFTEEILSVEAYQEAADWITTRSMVWRVRVECGRAAPGEPVDEATETRLRDRVALEAVIDLSGPEPRVASLRDVTYLGFGARPTEQIAEDGEFDADPEADELDGSADGPDAGRLDQPDELGFSSSVADPTPEMEQPDPDEAPTTDSDADEASGAGRDRIGRWIPRGATRK